MKMTVYSPNRGMKWALAMVCAMLVMLVGSVSGFADETANTYATVSFVDGDLQIGGEVAGSGLNFQFGEHAIPARSVSYPAVNENAGAPVDHILQVEDARISSGDWHVTVSMTSFTGVGPETVDDFKAKLTLVNPAVANANTEAGTAGLTVTGDLSITSDAGAELVMEADDTLPRGIFTAAWQNDNATLDISNAEVQNIGEAVYSATLTWSLNMGPN